MATRTTDLTEFAQPPANEMYAQLGSLKRVLSAGVLALYEHEPAMRQYYMARAMGFEIEKPTTNRTEPESEEEIQEQLVVLLKRIEVLLKLAPKPSRSTPKTRKPRKKKS